MSNFLKIKQSSSVIHQFSIIMHATRYKAPRDRTSRLPRMRDQVRKQMVMHPILYLSLVLIVTICILPVVMTVALTPLVYIANLGGYIKNKGIGYVMYNVFTLGSSLVVIFITLTVGTYSLFIGINILHSIVNSSFFVKFRR